MCLSSRELCLGIFHKQWDKIIEVSKKVDDKRDLEYKQSAIVTGLFQSIA